jgi:hypothetical protein
MALPTNHPIDEVVVYATTTDVTTGKTGAARAPFTGRVIKVGSMLGAASATADATVTVSIGATAITGGSYVITQAASAAGTTSSAVPTAANTCNEDDAILFALTGSGTAGGFVTHYAVVRKRAGV